MADHPKPKRRIVRRVVWTIVGVLLLPVLYLTTYLSFYFAWGVGVVPPPVCERLTDGFYAPLDRYIYEDYPGGHALLAIRDTVWKAGKEIGIQK